MAKPSSKEFEAGTVAMVAERAVKFRRGQFAQSAREAVLRQSMNDSRRALELAQTSYEVGKTDLRAVQQQQLSLQSAQLTLLRVQSEQLSQRTNLHLALGGSFAEPPALDSTDDQALQSTDGHGAILAAAR